jgi:hypothetical protein
MRTATALSGGLMSVANYALTVFTHASPAQEEARMVKEHSAAVDAALQAQIQHLQVCHIDASVLAVHVQPDDVTCRT